MEVLHAATRVRAAGLRDCGTAQGTRSRSLPPRNRPEYEGGGRRHREISSFLTTINAAQSTGRVLGPFKQPESSWHHAGVPWPLLGPAQGNFYRGCDGEGFQARRRQITVPRHGALFLNLPRPPLLCRRWLRYPWIDCVDKMGTVLFRNTAWLWESPSSHDWLRYLQ